MKKKLVAMVMMLSLVLSMMYSVIASNTDAIAEVDDWPLQISCDPEWPLFGPEVREKREESISGLCEGNKVTSIKVKNYSPKIVKISKVKKNSAGGSFWVKGLKKGYAHIKVTVKLKKKQDGKKKYVWNIPKYPVGHNDD